MKKDIGFVLFMLLFSSNLIWSQDTLILQPGPEGKDAHIGSLSPNQPNGTTAKFFCMGWTHSGIPGNHRSLVDFDLSMIPPDVEILDARLSLYYVCLEPNYVPQSGENESYIQLITSPWEENTVTWNTQPTTTMEDQVCLPRSTAPEQDYTGIDVTVPIRKIFHEPENYHGLMLRLINEYPYNCLLFASGDYMDNPNLRLKLEVIYTECPVPTVDFDYLADSLTYSFTGISPSATNWHWDFGDGDTSDLQDPVHTFALPGLFEVCLHVEDTCYFADHCEVVEICFAPPVAGFEYTTEDLKVFFQNSTVNATGYYWDFGDEYYSSIENPEHLYNSSGVYQVCLRAWNGCGADTVCQEIEICIPPVSIFDFNIEEQFAFFDNQSLEAESYYWDFGDGYYSTLVNPFHEYEMADDYLVCLTTWNACGADTTCEMLYFSEVLVPENDQSDITIYPNPARDHVFIKTNLLGTGRITLNDLSGKEVLRQDLELNKGQTIRLDVGNIPPGIFLLRIESEKTQSFGKLVVY